MCNGIQLPDPTLVDAEFCADLLTELRNCAAGMPEDYADFLAFRLKNAIGIYKAAATASNAREIVDLYPRVVATLSVAGEAFANACEAGEPVDDAEELHGALALISVRIRDCSLRLLELNPQDLANLLFEHAWLDANGAAAANLHMHAPELGEHGVEQLRARLIEKHWIVDRIGNPAGMTRNAPKRANAERRRHRLRVVAGGLFRLTGRAEDLSIGAAAADPDFLAELAEIHFEEQRFDRALVSATSACSAEHNALESERRAQMMRLRIQCLEQVGDADGARTEAQHFFDDFDLDEQDEEAA